MFLGVTFTNNYRPTRKPSCTYGKLNSIRRTSKYFFENFSGCFVHVQVQQGPSTKLTKLPIFNVKTKTTLRVPFGKHQRVAWQSIREWKRKRTRTVPVSPLMALCPPPPFRESLAYPPPPLLFFGLVCVCCPTLSSCFAPPKNREKDGKRTYIENVK